MIWSFLNFTKSLAIKRHPSNDPAATRTNDISSRSLGRLSPQVGYVIFLRFVRFIATCPPGLNRCERRCRILREWHRFTSFGAEIRESTLCCKGESGCASAATPQNDVQLLDSEASRNHAELSFQDDGSVIALTDLSSSNGTQVNGIRIDQRRSSLAATESRSAARC